MPQTSPSVVGYACVVSLPSTTARRPRALLMYQKMKANEMRVILLFGFIIFKKHLKGKYYTHFLKLVAAIHLAENRALSESMVQNVENPPSQLSY